jgi:hypothetical protein
MLNLRDIVGKLSETRAAIYFTRSIARVVTSSLAGVLEWNRTMSALLGSSAYSRDLYVRLAVGMCSSVAG